MVKIDKTSTPVPSILDVGGKGRLATDQFKSDFDQGILQFKFSSTIYGHKTVKEALKKAQNDKCCFCEAKVAHVSHGDVEHFRPKAGYNVQVGGKLTKPGYYWLAYDFSNLYFSCQICNQSFKKNYFPIADEAHRANSHNDDHALEDNLILDPALGTPGDHLVFEQEIIKPKQRSVKGTETIKRTGLNRDKLCERRLEALVILKTLASVARGNGPEAPEAKNHFKRLGQPLAEYSLMVCSNFPDLI